MTGGLSPTLAAITQILCVVAILAAVHLPLGQYMARTFTSPRHLKIERGVYRLARVDPDADQRWQNYLASLLGFSLVSILALVALLKVDMGWNVSLNTAISFVTNTNWQAYVPESATGIVAQMAGLTVQNFLSAAVGLAVVIALIRGITRSCAQGRIGNFWVDMTRSVVRILVPLAVISAVLLMIAGAIQNFTAVTDVTTLAGGSQSIPGGPVASQEAIKLLGTNGGGFFNANSAHPFENPTPASNILEIALLLLIPSALPRTFGIMVGDKRQGWSILAAMGTLWAASVAFLTWAEMAGSGAATQLAGSAMEGKEVRFGAAASALFASSSTMTSTGAVNAAHDSLTAPGGGTAMMGMLLGEVAPGGVGSGLYGMVILAIVTVFIGGLMVGRTPEYLGKKIRQREMTLVALYILIGPAIMLACAAITVSLPAGREAMSASGTHGLSQVLYAFASTANNNGSAFAGLTASGPLLTSLTSIAMLVGRFGTIALVVALAGSLSNGRKSKPGVGTLPTHTPLFIGLLVGIVVVVAGLTYVPALALGPIAESLVTLP